MGYQEVESTGDGFYARMWLCATIHQYRFVMTDIEITRLQSMAHGDEEMRQLCYSLLKAFIKKYITEHERIQIKP